MLVNGVSITISMWGKPIYTYQFEVVGEYTPHKKEGWSRPKAETRFDVSKACRGFPLVICVENNEIFKLWSACSRCQIVNNTWADRKFISSLMTYIRMYSTNGYVSKRQPQCELSWVSWNIPLTTAEHGLWLNLSKCSATLQFCLAERTSWQPLPHSHNTVSLLVVNTNRKTEPFTQPAPWSSH